MLRLLDRLLFARPEGQFRELLGITAHYQPPDIAAYRHYLPDSLEMPNRPVIKLFLIDYLQVSPWPFTRYQEWSLLLRASHEGAEGWFPLTMPVTTWIAKQGGHHLGFPKYVAETIELVDHGDTVLGHAAAKDRLEVSMRFTTGVPPQMKHWERHLLSRDQIIDDDLVVLKPVGVGPDVHRVRFEEVMPSRWTVRRGSVELTGDAGGLIATGRPVPGAVHHFRGGMNLVVASSVKSILPMPGGSTSHSHLPHLPPMVRAA
ncbi:MAG: hypothetical protein DWH79_06865 [Planctomycetota bacterium]|nr:MAG: hypothetical protein DWH79_06865 [Planctomycetota bacterium]